MLNRDTTRCTMTYALILLAGCSAFVPRVMAQSPPTVVTRIPAAGASVMSLISIRVTFSQRVSGVDAADLLVNGVPTATRVVGSTSNYTFSVPTPADGPVNVSWAVNHAIADSSNPSLLFDANGPGATWSFTFVDAVPPTIASRTPAAGTTVTSLTQIAVLFSENVIGVDAGDLRINGAPASDLTGTGSNYFFGFAQPFSGTVTVGWAAGHGITDLAATPNPFNGTTNWTYVLDEQIAPAIAEVIPASGSHVTDLTQVMVRFTEPVNGVNATDVRVNGIACTSVSGAGDAYTFAFLQPNGTNVNFTWAANHGIRDLAPAMNPFDANAPGATWSYTTIDNVPPRYTLHPPAGATVRRLTQIQITFDESVTGVDAADLLINDSPAQTLTGSGAGPYVFDFNPAPTGGVQVAFASGAVIYDTAIPSNLFPGGAWTYQVDPSILGEMAVQHVIQISMDGLGGIFLQNYVNTAPERFPTFIRLMNEGAYTFNARCDYDISETIPNHATMFTARPVFQPQGLPSTTHHGYNNNFPGAMDTLHNSGNTEVPYKASMFDIAHDYGRSTAFYASKTRLGICDRSYNATNGAPDVIGEDNGPDKIDFSSVLDLSGANITNEVNMIMEDLTSPAPKQYTFIHLAEPDLTGHGAGWGSVNWSNAVRLVDAQLGRIIEAIDTNPVLANKTALIVTADHGGGGVTPNGHTESYHILNYTIPFFLRAPGIPGGADLYSLFSNRGNPGTNRTDYTTRPQPVRGGDGSNLGLMLMGLPPIPGSFMAPAFKSASIALTIARFEDRIGVFWTDSNNSYLLEANASLGAAGWQTISNGISAVESTKLFIITNTTETPLHFFRLRKTE